MDGNAACEGQLSILIKQLCWSLAAAEGEGLPYDPHRQHRLIARFQDVAFELLLGLQQVRRACVMTD
jgi:hypothetical protein